MSKERADRFMASPSNRRLSRAKHPLAGLENEDNVKEWEEARCPVCFEHPHNAILLLCSSHDKGCHTFMCDTSDRHSNCFDLFKKSFTKDPKPTERDSQATITNTSGGRNDEGSSYMNPILLDEEDKPNLECPMCRGKITGWIIVNSARSFMDGKARSCSYEKCDFSGTYSDLQKHVKTVHPSVRPAAADPVRQRDWSRLEMESNFADVISYMRSQNMVENTLERAEYNNRELLTAYLLVNAVNNGIARSNRQSVVSSTRVTSGRRSRGLWGESTAVVRSAPNPEGALHPNELPRVRSIDSSGNDIATSRTRSRRQRGESPDDEDPYWISDGVPERARGPRSQRRRHGGTPPEN